MKAPLETDEQRMREAFEETAVQELSFEAGDFDREESGEYVEYVAEAAWQMFRARDAEVQALRALLEDALSFMDPVSPTVRHMRQQYAALAGEKGNSK